DVAAGLAAGFAFAIPLVAAFGNGLADLAVSLAGPARATLAEPEVGHVEVGERNADEVFPPAADHFSVRDVFSQVLADFPADDLLKTVLIGFDSQNHDGLLFPRSAWEHAPCRSAGTGATRRGASQLVFPRGAWEQGCFTS